MHPNPLSCFTPSRICLIDKIEAVSLVTFDQDEEGYAQKGQTPERQEDLVLSFLLRNISVNLGLNRFLSFTPELLTPAIRTYYLSLAHWRSYRSTDKPASESSCKTKLRFQTQGVVSWDENEVKQVKMPSRVVLTPVHLD